MAAITDFDDLILAEREHTRQQRDLANIPERVDILARDYIAAGGDPAHLVRIITDTNY